MSKPAPGNWESRPLSELVEFWISELKNVGVGESEKKDFQKILPRIKALEARLREAEYVIDGGEKVASARSAKGEPLVSIGFRESDWERLLRILGGKAKLCDCACGCKKPVEDIQQGCCNDCNNNCPDFNYPEPVHQ